MRHAHRKDIIMSKEKIITQRELGRRLNVPRSTVWGWVKSGVIKKSKMGVTERSRVGVKVSLIPALRIRARKMKAGKK